MLATPICRLRDTTDLPQKLVNNEYIRLTGDRAVEGKAGNAGNDGDAGSGDEGRKKTPNFS